MKEGKSMDVAIGRAKRRLRPLAERLLSMLVVIAVFAFFAWLIAGARGAAVAGFLGALFLFFSEDPTARAYNSRLRDP
jgi:hypothetical protein